MSNIKRLWEMAHFDYEYQAAERNDGEYFIRRRYIGRTWNPFLRGWSKWENFQATFTNPNDATWNGDYIGFKPILVIGHMLATEVHVPKGLHVPN